MKKIIVLIVFITFGCNETSKNSNTEFSSIKIPFDINKFKVINTISKPIKKETILLLADSTYIKEYYKSSNNQINQKGTVLVLYWNEINDPVWIGAKIHGEYLFADLIIFNDYDVNITRYNEKGLKIKLEKEDINNIVAITKTPIIFMP